MQIITEIITISTKGRNDIIDIGREIQNILQQSKLEEGNACIFVIGSTAAATTVEYEPGLIHKDMPELYEKIAPYNRPYAHHNTWGDDNGAAHLRASLTGSSLTIPFTGGKLLLGTWQQVVIIDFDTRPRKRKIVVQLTGKAF